MLLRMSVGNIVLGIGCLLALIGLFLLIRSFFPKRAAYGGAHSSFKRSRRYSGILFALGCVFTFVGLLALLLPVLGNAQIQLVLASFQSSSSNRFINSMNQAVIFALNNAWQVLFVGSVMLVIGLILLCRLMQESEDATAYQKLYARPKDAKQPLWEQPDAPVSQPNPFDDLAMWAQNSPANEYAPVKQQHIFPTVHEPLLERNQTDAASAAYSPLVPAVPPQPVPTPMSSFPVNPPQTVTEKKVEPSLPPASEIDVNDEAALAKYFPANEEKAAPQMVSPRIRSTMGQHRE